MPLLTVSVGRYRPADQDPSKESFNSRAGRHPLGSRARKLHQGILVVRFELPFNIWCNACQNHIGQGVRYNAEKKQVGSYYTTPIWSFRCKCHLCKNWFEIRTDPQVRNKSVCFLRLTFRTRATLLPPVPASRSVSRIASRMQLVRAPRKRGIRPHQLVMHSHSWRNAKQMKLPLPASRVASMSSTKLLLLSGRTLLSETRPCVRPFASRKRRGWTAKSVTLCCDGVLAGQMTAYLQARLRRIRR